MKAASEWAGEYSLISLLQPIALLELIATGSRQWVQENMYKFRCLIQGHVLRL